MVPKSSKIFYAMYHLGITGCATIAIAVYKKVLDKIMNIHYRKQQR
jgi:hypothetical protein